MLGIVENMSLHVCSQCGHEEPIFGHGGARRMAEQYGSQVLGELPLDIRIRLGADDGLPIMVSAPEGNLAQAYREIARRSTARLSLQPQPMGQPLVAIVED